MCFLPTDLDQPRGQDARERTVRRLADLLGVKASAFTEGQRPLTGDSRLVHQASEPELEAALSRIEDDETREYMAHLLATLDTLKGDAEP